MGPRGLLSALVCLLIVGGCLAISFELPHGHEECFYEDVHEGTNIHGAFAVVAGAHLDVDVAVWSPDGRQVYAANREGEGRFMIRADRDGTYKVCFSNKMSVMAHKAVSLVLEVGEPLDLSKIAKRESMENVERWILSISHTVRMIDFHQQEYKMLHERHLNSKYILVPKYRSSMPWLSDPRILSHALRGIGDSVLTSWTCARTVI
jgi:protein ERP2